MAVTYRGHCRVDFVELKCLYIKTKFTVILSHETNQQYASTGLVLYEPHAVI